MIKDTLNKNILHNGYVVFCWIYLHLFNNICLHSNQAAHMNFKIITPSKSQTKICLHRDRSEENQEIVRITAFVIDSAGQELMLDTVVQFADAGSARRFVADYSEESATIFLEECLEQDKILIIR